MVVLLDLTRAMISDLDKAAKHAETPGSRDCIWIQLASEVRRRNQRHGDARRDREEWRRQTRRPSRRLPLRVSVSCDPDSSKYSMARSTKRRALWVLIPSCAPTSS